MRRVSVVAVIIVGLCAAVLAQSKMGTPGDEAAILRNREAQNAAYNRHDAKAYAMLMAEEVDRTDASGTVFGRRGVEQHYSDLWLADSSAMARDESRHIRFVTSDVAILDIDAVVTRSSGTARNHATFVYAKRNGEWTAVAQRVFQKP